jgi:hypothetical protein
VVIPLATFPAQHRVVGLDPGGAHALLNLDGLIDRVDRQAAAAADPNGLVEPGQGGPADGPHRRGPRPGSPS